jgi:hypothetical protein
MVSDFLATLEQRLAAGGEEELAIGLVSLAYLAAAGIELADEELRPAARRAMLLLAAGGDPGRGLDLDGRAVRALAGDLETPERLEALADGLDGVLAQATGLAHVTEAARALRSDPDVAWRAYAAAVLGEELDAEIGDE